MFVEAFHHTLKYIYMKGFTNRRVDKCISLLVQFVRDRSFDRLIKLEKGRKSHRIRNNDRQHKASQQLSIEAVSKVSDSRWSVQSSDGQHYYLVEKVAASCSPICQLACKACGVCVHGFSCSCIDGVVRGTLCKHVHLVCRSLLSSEEAEPAIDDDPEACTGPQGDVLISEIVRNRERSPRGQHSKDSVIRKLKELDDLLGASTACIALDAVYKHINAAVQALKAAGSPSQSFSPVVVNVPQRVTPQRPQFKSTKKARSSSRVSLSKPTQEGREHEEGLQLQ
ncbi:uncharacterized protein LOC121408572 [Lytechinus variegatus]|uniref:uncharacterized protein LOC121408572 n=1 Tax=Lytechinus variegatus TaxID=7654 RepID=UPI001BB0E34F|nr:uncharacterized protein LOC121408572 [Lytechinus variegatus]